MALDSSHVAEQRSSMMLRYTCMQEVGYGLCSVKLKTQMQYHPVSQKCYLHLAISIIIYLL